MRDPFRLPDVKAVGSWRILQAQMEENRQRTLSVAESFPAKSLHMSTADFPNSLATQLVHLAAIEMDWLYADLLNQEIPADVLECFPIDNVRDEAGQLSIPRGSTLKELTDLLTFCRKRWHLECSRLGPEMLEGLVEGQEGQATAEWIVTHLLLHESEHRGVLKRMLQAFGGRA